MSLNPVFVFVIFRIPGKYPIRKIYAIYGPTEW